MWPVKNLVASDPDAKNLDIEKIEKSILRSLEEAAAKIEPTETSLLALDWVNGRRTPYANQKLTAAIAGIQSRYRRSRSYARFA